MSEKLTITFEILKVASPLVALFLTWFVGTKILESWEIRKKKKELDISITSEFYNLYGEFTSVWRLWKVHHSNHIDKPSLSGKSLENYWELLKRSSNVEGGMEAIFVKLASERILSKNEMNSLGLFRQAIQQLRQSIRDYDKMDWQRRHPEYILLKKLSVFVAMLINKSTQPPGSTLAAEQLTEITDANSKAWKNEAGEQGSYWFEKLQKENEKRIIS